MIMGHLGSRASALLDGQLPAAEAERAWAHVHACHACRDLVEREGWVKTRLRGLSFGDPGAPEHLKGSLLQPAGHVVHLPAYADRSRRSLGMVAIGGSAAGAAVVGVLALGLGTGGAPVDRQTPVTQIRQSETPVQVPELRQTTRP